MTVLEKIIIRKRDEVNHLLASCDEKEMRALAQECDSGRDFGAALRNSQRVPIIAEIKRASPSAGKIVESADVGRMAKAYQAGGAAALSVLTDTHFFGGDLEDLKQARAAVPLPVMRKDFIIHEIQLYESKIAGADAVLLIAACLDEQRLRDLYQEAVTLGMTPVVEVHGEDELGPVLHVRPAIVGINNRNLKTMEVDLQTSIRLRKLIPAGPLVVGESGISKPEDVRRLRSAGIDAFLVGTSLMKSQDPSAALNDLCRAGG